MEKIEKDLSELALEDITNRDKPPTSSKKPKVRFNDNPITTPIQSPHSRIPLPRRVLSKSTATPSPHNNEDAIPVRAVGYLFNITSRLALPEGTDYKLPVKELSEFTSSTIEFLHELAGSLPSPSEYARAGFVPFNQSWAIKLSFLDRLACRTDAQPASDPPPIAGEQEEARKENKNSAPQTSRRVRSSGGVDKKSPLVSPRNLAQHSSPVWPSTINPMSGRDVALLAAVGLEEYTAVQGEGVSCFLRDAVCMPSLRRQSFLIGTLSSSVCSLLAFREDSRTLRVNLGHQWYPYNIWSSQLRHLCPSPSFSPGLVWSGEEIYVDGTKRFLIYTINDSSIAQDLDPSFPPSQREEWRECHYVGQAPRNALLHSEIVAGILMLRRQLHSELWSGFDTKGPFRRRRDTPERPLRALIINCASAETRIIEVVAVAKDHICFIKHVSRAREAGWTLEEWHNLIGFALSSFIQ